LDEKGGSMKKFNREELILGALLPLMFVAWLGWWTLLAMPICSYLYARSGMEGEDKFWRRMLIPAVLSIMVAIATSNWMCLLGFPLGWASLSIGNGIPDVNDPEGSWLGRIWIKITRGNIELAGWGAKATIFFLLFLSIAMWAF
jgi:hypothetical protein